MIGARVTSPTVGEGIIQQNGGTGVRSLGPKDFIEGGPAAAQKATPDPGIPEDACPLRAWFWRLASGPVCEFQGDPLLLLLRAAFTSAA